MRRVVWILTASIVTLASLAPKLRAQEPESLGEAARAARKQKHHPARKVFTNDNLPTRATLSVVGPASAMASEEDEQNPGEDRNAQDNKKAVDSMASSAQKQGDKQATEKKESAATPSDQIADEKKKISDLTNELDLLQREEKLRIAAYYADAGTQLRDSKKWAEDNAKTQAEIAEKQKKLDEAKTHLEDLEEEARKGGESPSSPE